MEYNSIKPRLDIKCLIIYQSKLYANLVQTSLPLTNVCYCHSSAFSHYYYIYILYFYFFYARLAFGRRIAAKRKNKIKYGKRNIRIEKQYKSTNQNISEMFEGAALGGAVSAVVYSVALTCDKVAVEMDPQMEMEMVLVPSIIHFPSLP